MKTNYQPLVLLYGYKTKTDELNFVGRHGLITLSGQTDEIQNILALCNGMNNIQDIANELPSIDIATISELLHICENEGIVADSRELYIKFHEDSSNPLTFSHTIDSDEIGDIMSSNLTRKRKGKKIEMVKPVASKLLETISSRESTRQFQIGTIPSDQLAGLLLTTYSMQKSGHWSVASGGGLYPLDLYVIVPNNEQVIPQGIYQWDPKRNHLILVSEKNPNLWLTRVFNAKTILENATYVLCVAANLKRSTTKYANLGYRLTLLEAGHAVQNACLFCAEQKIGAVECCGFSDKELSKELGLKSPNETVLTTLIVGIANKDEEKTRSAFTDHKMVAAAGNLREALVGEGKPIDEVSVMELAMKGYVMSQWVGTCSHISKSSKKRKYAFATGSTTSEATVKALAEGFERYALGEIRSDRNEAAVNLNEAFLDPRIVVPYSSTQYEILDDIEPFDLNKKIDWVEGVRQVGGKRVWVPEELVYYSSKEMRSKRKLCYHTTSNGVAAHFEKQIAIRTALYELIERDAFSVMWHSKRCVYSIPHRLLPNDLRSRILCWEKIGYEVSILDITLEGPPVALVLIWSRKRTPALFSGASCRLSLFEATNRAFDEAEFMAMSWQHIKPKKQMAVADVKTPADHGMFYANPENLSRIEWLIEAPHCNIIRSDFDGDLGCFDPIIVDVTPKNLDCGLCVIRVLSEKLMPINFGYGNEHRGHSRISMLNLHWSSEYPSDPHFFA